MASVHGLSAWCAQWVQTLLAKELGFDSCTDVPSCPVLLFFVFCCTDRGFWIPFGCCDGWLIHGHGCLPGSTRMISTSIMDVRSPRGRTAPPGPAMCPPSMTMHALNGFSSSKGTACPRTPLPQSRSLWSAYLCSPPPCGVWFQPFTPLPNNLNTYKAPLLTYESRRKDKNWLASGSPMVTEPTVCSA